MISIQTVEFPIAENMAWILPRISDKLWFQKYKFINCRKYNL